MVSCAEVASQNKSFHFRPDSNKIKYVELAWLSVISIPLLDNSLHAYFFIIDFGFFSKVF
jgi:hypothetical protein